MYMPRVRSPWRPKSPPPSSGRWSLAHWNQLAQVGLLVIAGASLILAVVGYFDTVRPLYTKALLEEQIAEKELVLRRTTIEVATLSGQLTQSKTELSRLQRSIAFEKAVLADTLRQLSNANRKAEMASEALTLAMQARGKDYAKTRAVLLMNIKDSVIFCAHPFVGWDDRPRGQSLEKMATCIENFPKTSPSTEPLNAEDRRSLELQMQVMASAIRKEGGRIVSETQLVLDAGAAKIKQLEAEYRAKEAAAKGAGEKQVIQLESMSATYKQSLALIDVQSAATKRVMDLLRAEIAKLQL